jgi:hypothetical protein
MGNSIHTFSTEVGNQIVNVTINLNEYKCADRGLVLPLLNEFTWHYWVRGSLYLLGLLYMFLGIAIIADIFMCASTDYLIDGKLN